MSRCPGTRMREGGAEWLEAEAGPCPHPLSPSPARSFYIWSGRGADVFTTKGIRYRVECNRSSCDFLRV